MIRVEFVCGWLSASPRRRFFTPEMSTRRIELSAPQKSLSQHFPNTVGTTLHRVRTKPAKSNSKYARFGYLQGTQKFTIRVGVKEFFLRKLIANSAKF